MPRGPLKVRIEDDLQLSQMNEYGSQAILELESKMNQQAELIAANNYSN